jgi:hypothetical protein
MEFRSQLLILWVNMIWHRHRLDILSKFKNTELLECWVTRASNTDRVKLSAQVIFEIVSHILSVIHEEIKDDLLRASPLESLWVDHNSLMSLIS